ncbi:MAG: acyl-CoA dehydrogenase [Bacteroidetes bacterium]|nr:acyl-CoA dehydrogenase [Bacteroidota bacterium]
MKQDLESFLSNYRDKLHELFHIRNDENELTSSRGLPPYVLRQILECDPLSAFIPSEYGGRGCKTHEALSMLETTSYQSLPLSLMMGINGALFLQPLANYGNEEVKKEIFGRFIKEKNMGGLMITEPDYGSDALRMQTAYESENEHYHIKGLKHWAGLTGWADYWLITARETDTKGNLGRDVGFFVHDSRQGGIEVEEYYNNLGLYMLPYGKNHIDIKVHESKRLEAKSTGLKMMLDILHRSRLQFPGMSTGYLNRILDEALTHCKERFVGGVSLFNYDQVKERLAKLQSYFTVSSAMSFYTSENIPLEQDTSKMDLAANSIKSVVTDYMHSAAQSFLQLVGAKGYRIDHLAGRALVDSRPFQIFEGSNDILYQQISESTIKMMRKMKITNMHDFLSNYKLTEHAAGYFKESLDFDVDYQLPQRKLVKLGEAIGRIVAMNMTIKMGESGFNSDMISSSIKIIQSEVESIIAGLKSNQTAMVLEENRENSSWVNYLS